MMLPEDLVQLEAEKRLPELLDGFLGQNHTRNLQWRLKYAINGLLHEIIQEHFPSTALPRILICRNREDPTACMVRVGNITEAMFLVVMGRPAENDDLHRCNCKVEGTPGHWQCGWCEECDLPRFTCGHFRRKE